MARKDSKMPVARTRTAKAEAPVAANDPGELTLAALAKGILAREIRPRTADIRRLAEAVLAPAAPAVEAPAGKKAGKDGRKGKSAKVAEAGKDGGKKKDKAPGSRKGAGQKAKTEKTRKLAKIPGAKAKK